MKVRRRSLLLLVAFLSVRLFQAASATEAETFDFEEGYTITAAWELLHHRVWPLAAYQYTDWEGGSLVVVLLAVPLCWLFGPSLFVLKAVALFISSITFMALYALSKRAYGSQTATLACGLLLFSPDPILSYSLTAKGFHPDSAALQLLFLYQAVDALGVTPRRLRLFLLGLVAGFGTYFAYVFALNPMACAIVWLYRQRGNWFRKQVMTRVAPLLAGLLAGFSPLVVFNLRNGFAGFVIHVKPLISFISPIGLAEKLQYFARNSSAALARFAIPEGSESRIYLLYVVVFWTAAVGALVLPRRRGAALAHKSVERAEFLDQVVFVYAVFYFLLAILSRYAIASYHLVPLLVILLPRMSERLVWSWKLGRRGSRLLTATLVTSLLVVGGIANARLIHSERLGASLLLDARDYLQFYGRVCGIAPETTTFPHCLALNDRLPQEFGGGTPVVLRFFRTAPADLLKSHSAERRAWDAHFLTGYGLSLWHRDHADESGHARIMHYLARLEPTAMEPVLEGYGYGLCPLDDCLSFDWMSGIPSEGRERVAFGLGRSIAYSRFADSDGRYAIERLRQNLQSEFMRGLGYELGLRSLRAVPPHIAGRIPHSLRSAFWVGIAEGMAAQFGESVGRASSLMLNRSRIRAVRCELTRRCLAVENSDSILWCSLEGTDEHCQASRSLEVNKSRGKSQLVVNRRLYRS